MRQRHESFDAHHLDPGDLLSADLPGDDCVFDEHGLFTRFAGNEDLVFQILRIFLVEGPRRMKLLESCVARADGRGAVRHAHQLEASLRNVGAFAAARVAGELERLSSDEHTADSVSSVLESLREEMERLLPALKRLADELDPALVPAGAS